MLIQRHFWKQRWCSGFDWTLVSHEWTRVQIPQSTPFGLIVGSLTCSEFFFLENQHFHLLPLDLDHERSTRFNPMSGKQILKSKKFLFPESVIRKILLAEYSSRIWNPTDDWNPESKLHWKNQESKAWFPYMPVERLNKFFKRTAQCFIGLRKLQFSSIATF